MTHNLVTCQDRYSRKKDNSPVWPHEKENVGAKKAVVDKPNKADQERLLVPSPLRAWGASSDTGMARRCNLRHDKAIQAAGQQREPLCGSARPFERTDPIASGKVLTQETESTNFEDALDCSSVLLPNNDEDDDNERENVEGIIRRCESLNEALQQSNATNKNLQEALRKALERCDEQKAEITKLQNARDQYQHRYCVLDHEREGLQRVCQTAGEAERAARAAAQAATEEAGAWRRWTASILDLLLRRGATGFSVGISASQSLEEHQPRVHAILAQLADVANSAVAPEPELPERILSPLFSHVTQLITTKGLSVNWESRSTQASRKSKAEEHQQTADRERADLKQQLAQKEVTLATLGHEKRALQSELRALKNTLQELKGSVRIFCRVRPPIQRLALPNSKPGSDVWVDGERRVVIRKPPSEREIGFSFDRIFRPEHDQQAVYEEVAPLIEGILAGYHLCIFAYGQTGSGKTHTFTRHRSGARFASVSHRASSSTSTRSGKRRHCNLSHFLKRTGDIQ